MNESSDAQDCLLQETLRLMEALRESPDPETVAAVERWIRQSPQHAASFLWQVMIDEALCGLAHRSGRSIAEWIAIGREAYKQERKWFRLIGLSMLKQFRR